MDHRPTSSARRLPIYVGTDCTGIASILIALANLGVAFRHLFASDIEPSARTQVLRSFGDTVFAYNLLFRCWSETPLVDLYVIGFPCQPFSVAGSQEGFLAQNGNGRIFFHALLYIARKTPRVFIMENVLGLESAQGGHVFRAILRHLYALSVYNIYWQMLDTRDHGIPHSRPRYYFVGILKTWDRGTFAWPARCGCPPLDNFLLPRLSRPTLADLPAQATARENVIAFLRTMQAHGRDALEETWVIDCDSSCGRASTMYQMSCCMTRSRWQGHWVTSRGRRFTLIEQQRLQGIPDDFLVFITEAAFARHLGNSMSVNVLERVLVSLLPAAGLWESESLHDRWVWQDMKRKRGRI